MSLIRKTVVVDAPAAVAFAYMDDHRNVPTWMYGISAFTPITEQTSGVGATFESKMAVGPKTFRSVMKVTEWERDRVLTMDSIEGTKCTTSSRFVAGDDGSTTLELDFFYDLGGGLAGRALNKIVEPFVGIAVGFTESALRKEIAAAHRA